MIQNIFNESIRAIRKIGVALMLLLCATALFAQTVSPTVQPTQGGYFTGGNLQLQYTIGEPMNSTITAGSHEFSLGFEQPEMNIVIGSIAAGPYCAGSTIIIPFKAQGVFASNNIFTAQLSDSSGSFAGAVNIGVDTINHSDTVSATISFAVTGGTHYRIRIFVSGPVFMGGLSGYFTIDKIGTPTGISSQTACSDTAYTFTFSNVTAGNGGSQVEWAVDSSFSGSHFIASGSSFSLTVAAGTDSTIWVRSADSLSTCMSAQIKIKASVKYFPIVSITPQDTQIILGNNVLLTASGGTSYYWIDLDTTSIHVNVSPKAYITHYAVIVTDSFGCADTAKATVRDTVNPQAIINNYTSLFNQSDTNYYVIEAKMTYYFDSIVALLTSLNVNLDSLGLYGEDGPIANFVRWKRICQGRLGDNGDLTTAKKMLLYRSQQRALNLNFDCSSINGINPNWQCLGPFNSNNDASFQNQGRVTAVCANTLNPNTIYIGTTQGGVWKTYDAGAHWANITDVAGFSTMGIMDIKMHPLDTSSIYVGTGSGDATRWAQNCIGYGIGVIFSTDGGTTWQMSPFQLNPTQQYSELCQRATVSKIAIDPSSTTSSTNLIVLADDEAVKVNIGGSNSATVVVGNSGPCWNWVGDYAVTDVAYDPNDPLKVWVAATDGLHFSSDGGNTFTGSGMYPLSNPTNNFIAQLPGGYNIGANTPSPLARWIKLGIDNNSKLFVFIRTSGWQSLLSSADHGAHWSVNNYATPPLSRPLFQVNPNNSNFMYGGGKSDILKSTDGGVNWNPMSGTGHVDPRSLLMYSGSNNGTTDQLYYGNDGGVSKTPDGTTWSSINGQGLAIGMYYGVGASENAKDFFEAGAQDGSFDQYRSGVWTEAHSCCDNGEARIDPIDPNTFYLTSNCALDKFVQPNEYDNCFFDNAICYDGFSQSCPSCYYLLPMEIDPSNNSILFTSGTDHELRRSQDQGTTWQIVSGTDGCDAHSSVKVANHNANRVYYTRFGARWSDGVNFHNDGGIWRANDGGAGTTSWANISNNLYAAVSGQPDPPLYHSAGIMDMAIDPKNEDRIWVVMGGFYDGNKVFASEDGGATWNNMSTGLPNFPANTIVYQDGSNDMLYVGTDVGVYWYDKVNNVWNNYCPGLPQCWVFELRINYCSQKLIAATFGRGVWEADLIPGQVPNYTLSTNETWATDKEELQTVIITNGKTLTVTATINMVKGTNIIVQPGGKLIIDGGTLTNMCGSYWGGVIVQGDPSKSQSPITGSGSTGTYYQGAVFMSNEAKIENATNGIQCGVFYPTYQPGNEGGFVIATQSHFINNDRDIVAINYKRIFGRNLIPNRSYFGNCTFSTTAPLNDGKSPSTHVLLWNVANIFFTGCTFENTTTITNATYDYQLGDGIRAVDASFYVGDYCTSYRVAPLSCLPGTQSQFKNLRHGIYTSQWAGAPGCTVKHVLFSGCVRGIRDEGVNQAQFTANTIEVGNAAIVTDEPDLPGTPIDEGILLHQCSGFTVEGNDIYASGAQNVMKLGIRADGTGTAANQITGNNFGITNNSGLLAANVALRQNCTSPTVNPKVGLQYLCNQQQNNAFDIAAVFAPNDAPNLLYGIQAKQGSNNVPAQNTFTVTPFNNFYNNTANNVGYFYNDDVLHGGIANAKPVHHTNIKVSPHFTPFPTGCTSVGAVGTAGFARRLAGLSHADLAGQFSANDAISVGAKNSYKSLIDTGNTAGLTNFIHTHNYVADTSLVLSTLLSISPWLSTQPLIEAVNSTASLPDNALFQVLYANPDAVNNQNLISLITKIRGAGIDSLMDSVLNHQDSITVRTVLEDSILTAISLRDAAAFEIIGRLYQDTDSMSYDSLRYWLYNLHYPMADAQVAFTYIETGDIDSAANVMDSIYTKYNLTVDDSARIRNLDSVLNTYIIPWYNPQDSTLASLDSMQISRLNSFAVNSSEHLPGTNGVRNFLNILYQGSYFTPPALPVDSLSGRMLSFAIPKSGANAKISATGYGIKVFPNPANNYVNFEVDSADAGTVLYIYDMYGRAMIQKPFSGQLQINVNTQTWPTGIFLWMVRENEYPVGEGKLEIMK